MHQPFPADITVPASPLPSGQSSRILLFAMRRMAAHGLDDAHAAHAAFAYFGLGYRRPLVLVRAMMAEIARAAQRTLFVAPCCCARMTRDEAALLGAVETAILDPRGAHDLLERVMDTPETLGVVTTAQAVAQSFFDLGKPLSLYAA